MDIKSLFGGAFIADPPVLLQKLQGIKAFVFDWDGVFNNGEKDADGSSPFNEVDAMGTNLLRFNHYLRNGVPPVAAIITGERNRTALSFARREHFASMYCGIKFKADALHDLCQKYHLQPSEVAFMFDDVLDFSAAELCGLRIMVRRDCNPLMVRFAKESGLVDYLTQHDGAHYAIRETVELLTGISGRYDDTMRERAQYTDTYRTYLTKRNEQHTQLYTLEGQHIIPVDNL